jgi:hypothetical protein
LESAAKVILPAIFDRGHANFSFEQLQQILQVNRGSAKFGIFSNFFSALIELKKEMQFIELSGLSQ